jgi:Flp pilus assembly protein TadG
MHVAGRSFSRRLGCRRGAALVELVIVGSILAFILVASVDFARLFYAYVTITNCARGGALYGCQSETKKTDTGGIQTAALADAASLSPALVSGNISSSTGSDANSNHYVAVTVTYSFTTLITYPGISHTMPLRRTVQMRVVQSQPS